VSPLIDNDNSYTFPGSNSMKLSTVGHYRRKSTCYIATSVGVASTMTLPQQLKIMTTMMHASNLTTYNTPTTHSDHTMKRIKTKTGKNSLITNFFKFTMAPTMQTTSPSSNHSTITTMAAEGSATSTPTWPDKGSTMTMASTTATTTNITNK